MSAPILIGIDGNEANVAQRVGSNAYAWELLKALHGYLAQHPLLAVRVYLSRPPLPDLPAPRSDWQYRVVSPPKLWTQWRLPLDLWQQRDIKLFFSPGHYLPSLAPVPTVATIMDLAYERFPDQFRPRDLWQLRILTRWSVQQSCHLMAISAATKNDLMTLYHVPAAKITVAYPAVDKNTLPTTNLQSAKINWGITKPFFLYVGTLQPRKNLVRLIQAYQQYRQAGGTAQLVLAGKVGWLSAPIVAARDQSSYRSDIILTGYVSEAEKYQLMREALALVLVGLYEGFGIPPLEAVQLGTVPIVSNCASLPEVVGEHYPLLVDPYQTSAIAHVLHQVENAPAALRQQWLASARQQAQQFSWDKTALQVANTLFRLVSPLPPDL